MKRNIKGDFLDKLWRSGLLKGVVMGIILMREQI